MSISFDSMIPSSNQNVDDQSSYPLFLDGVSLREYMEKIAYTAVLYGFVPIPLKNKIPVIKGWTELRNDPIQDIEDIISGKYPKNVRRVGNLIQYKNANNVGIVTGEASGVVVIDIDIENYGLDTWNSLIESNSEIPTTFTVRTPSGGLHYYFKYTDDLQKIGNINRIYQFPIDYRTNGGMVLFPGSFSKVKDRDSRFLNEVPESFESKRNFQYQVIDGYGPYSEDPNINQITITEMPNWLKTLIVMDRIIKEDKGVVTDKTIKEKADQLDIILM